MGEWDDWRSGRHRRWCPAEDRIGRNGARQHHESVLLRSFPFRPRASGLNGRFARTRVGSYEKMPRRPKNSESRGPRDGPTDVPSPPWMPRAYCSSRGGLIMVAHEIRTVVSPRKALDRNYAWDRRMTRFLTFGKLNPRPRPVTDRAVRFQRRARRDIRPRLCYSSDPPKPSRPSEGCSSTARLGEELRQLHDLMHREPPPSPP